MFIIYCRKLIGRWIYLINQISILPVAASIKYFGIDDDRNAVAIECSTITADDSDADEWWC